MPSSRVTISVSDGFFDAYLALPPSGQGPGILLIQEIFGVNDHIKSQADKWAELGYVVLAPDLFWRMRPNIDLGYTGEDLQKALDYFQRFDESHGISDLKEAAEFLRDHKSCSGRIAALGFCLGGKLSYRLAANFNLNACVSYYGVSIEKHLEESAKIHCKTLLHFAKEDDFVPNDITEEIRSRLEQRDNFKIHLYEGVVHGFNCEARASYNEEAASLAFSRTSDLLKAELGLRN